MISTQIRMSVKWATLPHKYANETRRGKWGLSSTRPDTGVFIADAKSIRQVYYGITGELKGEIESRNGAREWKISYKQHRPSELVMGFLNPSRLTRVLRAAQAISGLSAWGDRGTW
jgi:hypothetical protein